MCPHTTLGIQQNIETSSGNAFGVIASANYIINLSEYLMGDINSGVKDSFCAHCDGFMEVR